MPFVLGLGKNINWKKLDSGVIGIESYHKQNYSELFFCVRKDVKFILKAIQNIETFWRRITWANLHDRMHFLVALCSQYLPGWENHIHRNKRVLEYVGKKLTNKKFSWQECL